jgi:quinoprotein glucose dehydrogenase
LFVDHRGRVMVCETFRQNQGVTDNRAHDRQWLEADLAARTVQDRIDYHRRLLKDGGASYQRQDDRLRLLQDTNGDGRADRSTVYANRFNQLEEGTGAGVLVRGHDAFYTCIPRLWRLSDIDGDGVAEQRQILSDGFGVRVAFRGHDLHGLIMGHDGRMYFSIGDRGYHVSARQADGSERQLSDPVSGAVFRCEMDGTGLEVFCTGLRNPQELAFDDLGRLFTGDNNSDSGDKARWVYLVQGGDSGWRMHYQYLSDRGPFNREGIWKPYQQSTPAYIIPAVANLADGPAGLACYPGTGFGDSLSGSFLLCDFRGQASNSGIRKLKLKAKGAFFEIAENEPLIWQVLATDVDFGPDGAIFFSDWVNGWDGEGKGRVYRIQDPGHATSELVRATTKLLASDFTKAQPAVLVPLLGHADRRVRLEAQWELAQRGQWQLLASAALNDDAPRHERLHALWGLGQIIRRDRTHREAAAKPLLALLRADDAALVAAAFHALADARVPIPTTLLKEGLSQADAQVQYAALMAVAALGNAETIADVLRHLESNADKDPILRHGGIMALAGQAELSKIASLKDHPSPSVRLAAVVALRKRQHPSIKDFLSDSEPRVLVEVFRAIHDEVALHAHLPLLASWSGRIPKSSPFRDAIWHRYLNAHYRQGGAESVEAVCRLASDPLQSELMRSEALEMLGQWREPGNLDRVLNDHRPITSSKADRDLPALVQSLRDRLAGFATAPNNIRSLAFSVATRLRVKEVVPYLERLVRDTNAPGDERARAIRDLLQLQGDGALELVKQMIYDSSPAVRIAALSSLADWDFDAALGRLRRAVSSDVRQERQAAWDLLGKIAAAEGDAILADGVERYLKGTLQPDCRLNVVEASRTRLAGDLEMAMASHLKELETYKEREPVKYYEDCLEGGDPASGRKLFFERSQLSCLRCHRVQDQGGEVGPVLTDIGGKKDARYLLEAIVAPNAQIAQGFETVNLATDGGLVVSGVLKSEDDAKYVLIQPDGAAVEVEKEEVVARSRGLSSMPADLIKNLNHRELRDLVAYLVSLDGKNPRAVPPGRE